MDYRHLRASDPEVFEAVESELGRQRENIELIPSENFASQAVLEALANPMQNKYAEGYPGRRYYGGCQFVDIAERLAVERAQQLFGAEHVNVQPLSGVPANMAAYFALADVGETIMGLALSHGGHLSHGHKVSFFGKWFNAVQYMVDRESERIDYAGLRRLAREAKPKIIVSGASAYPRIIEFDKFAEICEEVGAYHVADISHIAGLVAAGLHPSPVPYAGVVTTTTHKTLRGPRGAIIMCEQEHAAAIDRAVFPGLQGGPHMHVIAAKAVCFKEALTDEFKEYQRQIVKNAQALAEEFLRLGYRLVSGGTDNHLLLIDLRPQGLTGKLAEEALDRACITVNKNAIPYDPRPPRITSGIRLGTPAVTTRGMGEEEMRQIARLVDETLRNHDDERALAGVREEACALAQ
ncbi:MAG: serine hydroxymethyltransferase, partial [Candidatus Bipolaricaulia bacterium]